MVPHFLFTVVDKFLVRLQDSPHLMSILCQQITQADYVQAGKIMRKQVIMHRQGYCAQEGGCAQAGIGAQAGYYAQASCAQSDLVRALCDANLVRMRYSLKVL
jgi:hypothetical protein